MRDLKDKGLDDLKIICRENGLAAFKAKEIFSFIHKKLGVDLQRITTLKKEEREKLAQEFYISTISPHKSIKNQNTEKAAFKLEDGQTIETVMMRHEEGRLTLCLSCQTGCPIGCLFCATGTLGPGRNLTVAEILSQVYYFAKKYKVSNLVFMGMGEPFLNYDNVLKAIRMLNIEIGLNIAARKIVVSTIGIIAGIEKFSCESKQLRLAWSLTAPSDEQRTALLGYKRLPSIRQTIEALRYYQEATKRRITIEYVLLKNINDGDKEAQELGRIAGQLDCHINLIPYNASSHLPFERGETEHFRKTLKAAVPEVKVTVRESFGQEISAACGQLAG